MSFATRNTFGKATLAVLGVRGYFRPGTTLTAAASSTDTTITVSDPSLFTDTDTIIVGSGADQEEVTISAISGSDLTVSALSNDQPQGAMVRLPGWVDMGILADWEPQDETEELEIQGARSGLTETYETLAISASLAYGFTSNNPNDEEILALWNGGAMTEDPGATGASAPITFDSTSGELMFVRENAQSAKPSQILYHPAASIRRDGQAGTPGEEESGLTFSATVTAKEGFTIPADVDAATPAARYGYLYKVPTSALDDAIDTVSDGVAPA